MTSSLQLDPRELAQLLLKSSGDPKKLENFLLQLYTVLRRHHDPAEFKDIFALDGPLHLYMLQRANTLHKVQYLHLLESLCLSEPCTRLPPQLHRAGYNYSMIVVVFPLLISMLEQRFSLTITRSKIFKILSTIITPFFYILAALSGSTNHTIKHLIYRLQAAKVAQLNNFKIIHNINLITINPNQEVLEAMNAYKSYKAQNGHMLYSKLLDLVRILFKLSDPNDIIHQELSKNSQTAPTTHETSLILKLIQQLAIICTDPSGELVLFDRNTRQEIPLENYPRHLPLEPFSWKQWASFELGEDNSNIHDTDVRRILDVDYTDYHLTAHKHHNTLTNNPNLNQNNANESDKSLASNQLLKGLQLTELTRIFEEGGSDPYRVDVILHQESIDKVQTDVSLIPFAYPNSYCTNSPSALLFWGVDIKFPNQQQLQQQQQHQQQTPLKPGQILNQTPLKPQGSNPLQPTTPIPSTPGDNKLATNNYDDFINARKVLAIGDLCVNRLLDAIPQASSASILTTTILLLTELFTYRSRPAYPILLTLLDFLNTYQSKLPTTMYEFIAHQISPKKLSTVSLFPAPLRVLLHSRKTRKGALTSAANVQLEQSKLQEIDDRMKREQSRQLHQNQGEYSSGYDDERLFEITSYTHYLSTLHCKYKVTTEQQWLQVSTTVSLLSRLNSRDLASFIIDMAHKMTSIPDIKTSFQSAYDLHLVDELANNTYSGSPSSTAPATADKDGNVVPSDSEGDDDQYADLSRSEKASIHLMKLFGAYFPLSTPHSVAWRSFPYAEQQSVFFHGDYRDPLSDNTMDDESRGHQNLLSLSEYTLHDLQLALNLDPDWALPQIGNPRQRVPLPYYFAHSWFQPGNRNDSDGGKLTYEQDRIFRHQQRVIEQSGNNAALLNNIWCSKQFLVLLQACANTQAVKRRSLLTQTFTLQAKILEIQHLEQLSQDTPRKLSRDIPTPASSTEPNQHLRPSKALTTNYLPRQQALSLLKLVITKLLHQRNSASLNTALLFQIISKLASSPLVVGIRYDLDPNAIQELEDEWDSLLREYQTQSVLLQEETLRVQAASAVSGTMQVVKQQQQQAVSYLNSLHVEKQMGSIKYKYQMVESPMLFIDEEDDDDEVATNHDNNDEEASEIKTEMDSSTAARTTTMGDADDDSNHDNFPTTPGGDLSIQKRKKVFPLQLHQSQNQNKTTPKSDLSYEELLKFRSFVDRFKSFNSPTTKSFAVSLTMPLLSGHPNLIPLQSIFSRFVTNPLLTLPLLLQTLTNVFHQYHRNPIVSSEVDSNLLDTKLTPQLAHKMPTLANNSSAIKTLLAGHFSRIRGAKIDLPPSEPRSPELTLLWTENSINARKCLQLQQTFYVLGLDPVCSCSAVTTTNVYNYGISSMSCSQYLDHMIELEYDIFRDPSGQQSFSYPSYNFGQNDTKLNKHNIKKTFLSRSISPFSLCYETIYTPPAATPATSTPQPCGDSHDEAIFAPFSSRYPNVPTLPNYLIQGTPLAKSNYLTSLQSKLNHIFPKSLQMDGQSAQATQPSNNESGPTSLPTKNPQSAQKLQGMTFFINNLLHITSSQRHAVITDTPTSSYVTYSLSAIAYLFSQLAYYSLVNPAIAPVPQSSENNTPLSQNEIFIVFKQTQLSLLKLVTSLPSIPFPFYSLLIVALLNDNLPIAYTALLLAKELYLFRPETRPFVIAILLSISQIGVGQPLIPINMTTTQTHDLSKLRSQRMMRSTLIEMPTFTSTVATAQGTAVINQTDSHAVGRVAAIATMMLEKQRGIGSIARDLLNCLVFGIDVLNFSKSTLLSHGNPKLYQMDQSNDTNSMMSSAEQAHYAATQSNPLSMLNYTSLNGLNLKQYHEVYANVPPADLKLALFHPIQYNIVTSVNNIQTQLTLLPSITPSSNSSIDLSLNKFTPAGSLPPGFQPPPPPPPIPGMAPGTTLPTGQTQQQAPMQSHVVSSQANSILTPDYIMISGKNKYPQGANVIDGHLHTLLDGIRSIIPQVLNIVVYHHVAQQHVSSGPSSSNTNNTNPQRSQSSVNFTLNPNITSPPPLSPYPYQPLHQLAFLNLSTPNKFQHLPTLVPLGNEDAAFMLFHLHPYFHGSKKLQDGLDKASAENEPTDTPPPTDEPKSKPSDDKTRQRAILLLKYIDLYITPLHNEFHSSLSTYLTTLQTFALATADSQQHAISMFTALFVLWLDLQRALLAFNRTYSFQLDLCSTAFNNPNSQTGGENTTVPADPRRIFSPFQLITYTIHLDRLIFTAQQIFNLITTLAFVYRQHGYSMSMISAIIQIITTDTPDPQIALSLNIPDPSFTTYANAALPLIIALNNVIFPLRFTPPTTAQFVPQLPILTTPSISQPFAVNLAPGSVFGMLTNAVGPTESVSQRYSLYFEVLRCVEHDVYNSLMILSLPMLSSQPLFEYLLPPLTPQMAQGMSVNSLSYVTKFSPTIRSSVMTNTITLVESTNPHPPSKPELVITGATTNEENTNVAPTSGQTILNQHVTSTSGANLATQLTIFQKCFDFFQLYESLSRLCGSDIKILIAPFSLLFHINALYHSANQQLIQSIHAHLSRRDLYYIFHSFFKFFIETCATQKNRPNREPIHHSLFQTAVALHTNSNHFDSNGVDYPLCFSYQQPSLSNAFMLPSTQTGLNPLNFLGTALHIPERSSQQHHQYLLLATMRRFMILLHTSTVGTHCYQHLNTTVGYRYNKDLYNPSNVVDNNAFIPPRSNPDDFSGPIGHCTSVSPTPYTLIDLIATVIHLETLDAQNIMKGEKVSVFVSILPSKSDVVMPATIRTLVSYLIPHNTHIFTPAVLQIFLDRLMAIHQQLTPQQQMANNQSTSRAAVEEPLASPPPPPSHQPHHHQRQHQHQHQHQHKGKQHNRGNNNNDNQNTNSHQNNANNTTDEAQSSTAAVYPPFPRHFWHTLSLMIAAHPDLAAKFYTMTSRFFISRYWNDSMYRFDFYDISYRYKGFMYNLLHDFITARPTHGSSQSMDNQRQMQVAQSNAHQLQASSFRLLVRLPYQVLHHSSTVTYGELQTRMRAAQYQHYCTNHFETFIANDLEQSVLVNMVNNQTNFNINVVKNPQLPLLLGAGGNNGSGIDNQQLQRKAAASSNVNNLNASKLAAASSTGSAPQESTNMTDAAAETTVRTQTPTPAVSALSQQLQFNQSMWMEGFFPAISPPPASTNIGDQNGNQELEPDDPNHPSYQLLLFPIEETQLYVALQWYYDRRSHNVLNRHLQLLTLRFLQTNENQLPQWFGEVYNRYLEHQYNSNQQVSQEGFF